MCFNLSLVVQPHQENFFDIQEALQAIHMRQEMLREQLACAKLKGEEMVGRNLQVRGHLFKSQDCTVTFTSTNVE